ncbi:MAG: Lamin Tail Domain, partial [Verrucomicrobiota bacterium]
MRSPRSTKQQGNASKTLHVPRRSTSLSFGIEISEHVPPPAATPVRPDASVARPVHALSRKALEEIPLSSRPPSSAPSTVSRTLPLRLALLALALALRFLSIESPATPPVVINEIHFHPAEKRTTEFIEIHNPGTDPVDLSRWTL